MNRIQKISQDLMCQKLKLQMGIDPRVEIEPITLQAMWSQLQRERNLECIVFDEHEHYQDRAA